MLAENELWNITYAEASVSSAAGKPAQRESYAPTEPGRSTGLVFPGPRMQLRAQIVTPKRRYSLRGVFVIDLSYLEGGEVFASHRRLPVHAHGVDQQSALAAFCEAFDFQFRNLVDVPEGQLTSGGLNRRHAIQEAVEKVDEIDG